MVATTMRIVGDHRHESPYWYDEHASFMPDMDSPMRILSSHPPNAPHNHPFHPSIYPCKQEQQLGLHYTLSQDTSFFDLPHLESPKIPILSASTNNNSYGFGDQSVQQNYQLNTGNNVVYGNSSNSFPNEQQAVDQMSTDWRVLDKFVASQLSHQLVSGERQNYYLNNGAAFEADQEDVSGLVVSGSKKVLQTGTDFASSSTSGGQDDPWK
ncbi:hypothetical protein QQ045_019401 [Rhodiola kirilowii]